MSTRTERTAVIESLEKEMKEATAIYVADYYKINVERMTKLRAEFRKSGTRFMVVKNKLVQHALKKIGKEDLIPFFKGPTAIALIKGDSTVPAKVIKEFQKENKEFLKLKVAWVEGATFSPEDALKLADLPSREVLLSQLVGCLQAPIGKLAGTLSGILVKFVATLNAVKEKKGG